MIKFIKCFAIFFFIIKSIVFGQNKYEWYQLCDSNFIFNTNNNTSKFIDTNLIYGLTSNNDENIFLKQINGWTLLNTKNGKLKSFLKPKTSNTIYLKHERYAHLWDQNNSVLIHQDFGKQIVLNKIYDGVYDIINAKYILAKSKNNFDVIDNTNFKVIQTLPTATQYSALKIKDSNKDTRCIVVYGGNTIYLIDYEGNIFQKIKSEANNIYDVIEAVNKVYPDYVDLDVGLDSRGFGAPERGNWRFKSKQDSTTVYRNLELNILLQISSEYQVISFHTTKTKIWLAIYPYDLDSYSDKPYAIIAFDPLNGNFYCPKALVNALKISIIK